MAKPKFGPSPLEVQFYADKSYDPNGNIVSYLWDFGDGSTSEEINPIHIYQNSSGKIKTYKASLTVKDTEGAIDTAKTAIIVYSASSTKYHSHNR